MVRCIHSPFTDIYFHLAAEEYLLKQGADDVFMLWQDTPSVVMGKHQRVQSEVDREWAELQQIHIARRFSGGGTVYHDLGNVNLTFIETVSRLPDFKTYLHRVLEFFVSIGLTAEGDERLGIYLHGLKISGSAQCVYKNRVLYHCTLLYDTDMTILNKVLNPEGKIEEKMEAKIELIIKKYKKGCSAEETADMLEEPINLMRQIYEMLDQYTPDYDVEKIYKGLLEKAILPV